MFVSWMSLGLQHIPFSSCCALPGQEVKKTLESVEAKLKVVATVLLFDDNVN